MSEVLIKENRIVIHL